MNTSSEDDLVELLVAYDEALALGRVHAFLNHASFGEDTAFLERWQRARSCLQLMADAWPASDRAATAAPVRVGRFEVERELGRGGFGVVYLAFDPVLKRHVALKIPRLETLATPDLRRRFLREAELTAGMDHPHIMAVYEAGQAGGVGYIASAYCPGPDLQRWLAERTHPLAVQTAVALIVVLAEALHYCHGQGVVHRDLKPSNVLLMPCADRDGISEEMPFVPRLTDFGLAKIAEASLAETRSSVVLGTPLYMAPEQAEGQTECLDPRTDIYALGAILFELLTGRPPFQGRSILELLAWVRSEQPIPPRRLRPGIPREVETITLKCLEKEPSHRYATAQELADDIRRYQRGETTQARARTWISQLRAWSRRPERIGEAALLAILVGLVATASATSAILGILTGFIPDASGTLWPATVGNAIYPLLQFFLAWKTLARRGWAIWLGAVGMPLLTIYSIIGMLGGIGMSDLFSSRDRPMQMLLLATGSTLHLLESVLYFAALQAYRAGLPRRPS